MGSADTVTADAGHFDVTWHHDGWADNIEKRKRLPFAVLRARRAVGAKRCRYLGVARQDEPHTTLVPAVSLR